MGVLGCVSFGIFKASFNNSFSIPTNCDSFCWICCLNFFASCIKIGFDPFTKEEVDFESSLCFERSAFNSVVALQKVSYNEQTVEIFASFKLRFTIFLEICSAFEIKYL